MKKLDTTKTLGFKLSPWCC